MFKQDENVDSGEKKQRRLVLVTVRHKIYLDGMRK